MASSSILVLSGFCGLDSLKDEISGSESSCWRFRGSILEPLGEALIVYCHFTTTFGKVFLGSDIL